MKEQPTSIVVIGILALVLGILGVLSNLGDISSGVYFADFRAIVGNDLVNIAALLFSVAVSAADIAVGIGC